MNAMLKPGHAQVQLWACSALKRLDVRLLLGKMVQIKLPMTGAAGTFPYVFSCSLVT